MTDIWMCAHDLSPHSDAAAREAARMAAALSGKLLLLHVHRREAIRPEQQWGDVTTTTEHELARNLETLATGLRETHPRLEVTVQVMTGDPLVDITAEADRVGVTHLVVGTHGRTGLAHLLLGSVAEHIVRHARQSVHVIRTLR